MLGMFLIFDKDLKEVHSQVIQDILKRIDRSFKSFFRRVSGKRREKAGYPRYKRSDRYDSFMYPQGGFKLEDRKLILSPRKIGSINIKTQKSSIFEQLKNVGQELSEFKHGDFSKRRWVVHTKRLGRRSYGCQIYRGCTQEKKFYVTECLEVGTSHKERVSKRR
jgi:transposase